MCHNRPWVPGGGWETRGAEQPEPEIRATLVDSQAEQDVCKCLPLRFCHCALPSTSAALANTGAQTVSYSFIL